MTLNKLASKIAKLEGKKSQARIGDIREILGILSDLWFEEVESSSYVLDLKAKDCTDVMLYLNGKRRAKGKKK
jgi:hypothetical protein